ncbi:MAG: ATP-binding cassette domain-containing protein, partial [Anaerorhabdus sp.]
MKKIIELKSIEKKFGEREILKDFNMEVYENEMVAIMGKSGSGKTTILNILGYLEPFNKGSYIFEDKSN